MIVVLLSLYCLPKYVCELRLWEDQAFLCFCSHQAFSVRWLHISTVTFQPGFPVSSCIKNLHFSIFVLGLVSKAPVANIVLSCLALYEHMKIQPLPPVAYSVLAPHNTYPQHQALLTLFPGMDMYKMNIIWKQWNILPRPPNMCLLLITLVHYSSTSKQNEWPRFRSLCIPPPLFPTHYALRP